MAAYDKKISADTVAEKLLSALKEEKEKFVEKTVMTVGDILGVVAPDADITICEADGRQHYVGAPRCAHAFDNVELEQIRAYGSRVVLIIASEDIL